MSNLVYLMAGLPSLSFGQAPPLTLDEFIDNAKSQLSARHFKMLQSVDIQNLIAESGEKSIDSLLTDIQMDLYEIKNAKAKNRHAKLQHIPESALLGNPLEREKNIMQWQWEALHDMKEGKTFTLTEVLVYKLKLQILIRLNSFDKAKGSEVLASVTDPEKIMEGK